VAGHRGLAGSAIVRRLEREPIAELVTAASGEVDLTRLVVDGTVAQAARTAVGHLA
jgi:GDP-L-fucose synthase